jgi:small subunit ribosomal protein S20
VATSRSSKKRIRQTNKWREIHRGTRSEVKTLVKKQLSLIDEAKDAAKAKEMYLFVQKKLDKAGQGHALHKNTIARRKSRLAKKLNKLLAQGGGAAPAKK